MLKKGLVELMRNGSIYMLLEAAETVDDLKEVEAFLDERDTMQNATMLLQDTGLITDKLYEVEDEDFRNMKLELLRRIDPSTADNVEHMLKLKQLEHELLGFLGK